MSRADVGLHLPAGSDTCLRDPALCYAAAMSALARRIVSLDDECRAAFARWMQGVANLIVDRCEVSAEAPVQSRVFHRTTRWRLGLVGLAGGAIVPLHDHPRAFGLSLVMSGSLDVGAYEIAAPEAGRHCRLRRAWSRELASGELSIMDPWRVNLHRLCAGERGAVIMTATLSVQDELCERSWYVNLRELGDGELAAVKVANAELETLQRLKRQMHAGGREPSAA